MNKLTKLYYHLTAYVPRKLPTTEAELLAMVEILKSAYGVKDEPQTYAMLAGCITSTPNHSIRRSYGYIVNSIHRLRINALAQSYRIAAIEELKYKVEQAVKQEVERMTEVDQKAGLENGFTPQVV